MKNVINKHKSNKIKENSNTVRHLNNGTDRRHSKSCCDQSSPARRTMTTWWPSVCSQYWMVAKKAYASLVGHEKKKSKMIEYIMLSMASANERRCYIVMPSLIGWAHTQNDPCWGVVEFVLTKRKICASAAGAGAAVKCHSNAIISIPNEIQKY